MKRLLAILVLLCLSISIRAQTTPSVITMHDAATATGNGTAIVVGVNAANPGANLGAVGVQIVGSGTWEVTFEATTDGTNWSPVMATNLEDDVRATTATAAGQYTILYGSAIRIRARISSFSSGSVTVKGRLIPGLTARLTSGGGGGGGSGDVVGPASATDNAVARFNLTTGKLIQNSVVTIGDTGNTTGIANLTFTGVLTGGSAPTTITDSAGKILSAALNTVQPAQGGTGITALGTGIATALGVNIGSAGAPVLFDGAGGTPSSLTLTNATGLPLSTGVTGNLPFANFVQAGSAGFVGATGAGDYSHRTPAQVTAALDAFVGDSGSGGTKGLVPAPASGDAAANKYLKADGTWATVAGGGTPGGSNTQVQYNNAGSFGGVAGFTFNGTSTISLGVAGTSVGAIGFRNATSGTITLQPVTGALGTVTLSLPAATDTLVGRATTDTLSNKTLASPSLTGNLSGATTSEVRFGANIVAYEDGVGPKFTDFNTGAMLTFDVQNLTGSRIVTWPNVGGNVALTTGTLTNGNCAEFDASGRIVDSGGTCGGGSGTVTSVGLALPGIFSISGSPVTSSGTLTAELVNQNANLVFAGPGSGGPAVPTFRALVANDYVTMVGDSGAGGVKGAVPAPAAGDAAANKFLKADGVWTAIPSAPVTSVFGRTDAVVAQNGDYSFSQISGTVADGQLSANVTLQGNTVTGTGAIVLATSPTIVTPTIASFVNAAHNHENVAGGGQLNATNIFNAGTVPVARLPLLVGDSGAGGIAGLVPAPAAGDAAANKYLKADGTWATVAGGGAVEWQAITGPTGNAALAMAAFTTAWTWNATTGASNLFSLTDTTGNTGTGYVLSANTASGSAAKPIRITAGGTSNGVEMTTAGVLAAIGSGEIRATMANPSASIGLTANNGSATTAMRSDATPALSQAIAPTWTGLHTFNPGTTPQSAILLTINAIGSPGTRDSHDITFRGRSDNGTPHTVDWKLLADVTTNAGASQFVVRSNLDGGSFTDWLTIADSGTITGGSFVGANFTTAGGSILGDDVNAATGFTVAGAAASGQYLRGDGTRAVFAAIASGDLPSTVVRTDQANTYSTGAQNFTSATSLTVPVSAGASPTANGTVAYDSTANALEYGDNGTNRTVANLDEAQTFTNKTISGASNTLSNIANASLTNSAITIAGTSTSLGGTISRDTITGVSSNGILARTAANTLTNRTITAGSASITVTDGDGVNGNPTINTVQNIQTTATPQFARLGLGSAAGSVALLTVTGGTVTADSPVMDLTQTWNNAAVAFNGIKLNVTNTASLSTSNLIDLQVGGSSQFAVSRGGTVSAVTVNASSFMSVGGASVLTESNSVSNITGKEFNGIALETTTSAASATLTNAQTTILCNASGAVRTYTLPAASSNAGRVYWIKKTDSSANACIIDGNSSETIDGNLTISVTGQYDAIAIQSDGSNWFRLGSQLVAAEAGYINGLQLEWVSTTQVRVTPGAAQLESTKQFLVVPTALTISPTLGANTWYHCYVYDNSGVGALECVTTAPATAWTGTARSKTGDTTRRYVGSIRTNGSSQLFNFFTEGAGSLQVVRWRNDVTNDNRILANGSASTNTNVDASSRAPVTSRAIEVTIYNLATGGVAYFDTNDAGSAGTGLDPDSAIGLFALNSGRINTTYLPLNSSQVFRYAYSGTPTGSNFIYIDVLGYRMER